MLSRRDIFRDHTSNKIGWSFQAMIFHRLLKFMGLKLTELRDYLDFIKKLIIAGLQVSMKHCSEQKLVGRENVCF